MTSDAPESPKKGSAADSTSSSPGNAGGTGKAWVVGEPSSADINPENSQQDVESLFIVEISACVASCEASVSGGISLPSS
jgi:hypothetical protein